MNPIVDPTNDNVALVDGEVAYAIRFVSALKDPAAPTAAELSAGTIIGYSNQAWVDLGQTHE